MLVILGNSPCNALGLNGNGMPLQSKRLLRLFHDLKYSSKDIVVCLYSCFGNILEYLHRMMSIAFLVRFLLSWYNHSQREEREERQRDIWSENFKRLFFQYETYTSKYSYENKLKTGILPVTEEGERDNVYICPASSQSSVASLTLLESRIKRVVPGAHPMSHG